MAEELYRNRASDRYRGGGGEIWRRAWERATVGPTLLLYYDPNNKTTSQAAYLHRAEPSERASVISIPLIVGQVPCSCGGVHARSVSIWSVLWACCRAWESWQYIHTWGTWPSDSRSPRTAPSYRDRVLELKQTDEGLDADGWMANDRHFICTVDNTASASMRRPRWTNTK
jgi:hypothetical protein